MSIYIQLSRASHPPLGLCFCHSSNGCRALLDNNYITNFNRFDDLKIYLISELLRP